MCLTVSLRNRLKVKELGPFGMPSSLSEGTDHAADIQSEQPGSHLQNHFCHNIDMVLAYEREKKPHFLKMKNIN